MIQIKRIYDPVAEDDGYRMLVDRIWPRGVKKLDAALDEWNKNIGPSPELRNWFGHKPENFAQFEKRYKIELQGNKEELSRLLLIASQKKLTLLFGAKDKNHNQAVVLMDTLIKLSDKDLQ